LRCCDSAAAVFLTSCPTETQLGRRLADIAMQGGGSQRVQICDVSETFENAGAVQIISFTAVDVIVVFLLVPSKSEVSC
jgi:hypothetical protein